MTKSLVLTLLIAGCATSKQFVPPCPEAAAIGATGLYAHPPGEGWRVFALDAPKGWLIANGDGTFRQQPPALVAEHRKDGFITFQSRRAGAYTPPGFAAALAYSHAVGPSRTATFVPVSEDYGEARSELLYLSQGDAPEYLRIIATRSAREPGTLIGSVGRWPKEAHKRMSRVQTQLLSEMTESCR